MGIRNYDPDTEQIFEDLATISPAVGIEPVPLISAGARQPRHQGHPKVE